MPSYHTHEIFASFLTIPLAYLYYKITGDLRSSFVFLISMVFGVFFLSPDLDTKSKSYKRWGIFRFMWIPYMKLVKHRSFISHFPVISSFIRAVYLSFSLAFVAALLIYVFTLVFAFLGVDFQQSNFFAILKNSLFTTIRIIFDIDRKYVFAFIIGISAGDTLHVLLDILKTKIR